MKLTTAIRYKDCVSILEKSIKLLDDKEAEIVNNIIFKYKSNIDKYNISELDLINPTEKELNRLYNGLIRYFKSNSKFLKRVYAIIDNLKSENYKDKKLITTYHRGEKFEYYTSNILHERYDMLEKHCTEYEKKLTNLIHNTNIDKSLINSWILIGRRGRTKDRLTLNSSDLIKQKIIKEIYNKNKNFNFK